MSLEYQNSTPIAPPEQIEKYAALKKGHIMQADYNSKKKQLLDL